MKFFIIAILFLFTLLSEQTGLCVRVVHADSSNRGLTARTKETDTQKGKLERHQGNLLELFKMTNPDSKFNVWLTIVNDSAKKIFYDGEEISFFVKSDESATLLLLNLDPQGYISIVYPATTQDNGVIGKGESRVLGESGKVSEPLGNELLKLFAFRAPLPEIAQFIGRPPITPDSPEFVKLAGILKKHTRLSHDWAESTVEIVTQKR